MGSKVLLGALELASCNLAFMLIFRALSFVMHGLMVRYLSNDVLGVINVRLSLLYWTTLMISHDALRRACLGDEGKHSKRHWRKVTNLLWTAVPTAAVFGGILGALWMWVLERPSEEVTPCYNFAVCTVVLGVIVENLAEPLFSLGQAFLYAKLRAIIDTATMLVRMASIALLMYVFPNYPAEAFGVGILLGSLLFTSSYYIYFYYHLHFDKSKKEFPFDSVLDFLPQKQENDWFIKEQTGLLWSFLKQIFLKQVLIDGERYVITFFDLLTFSQQGEYDAVTNTGVITAKLLLYPIEEASYLYFAKLVKRNKAAVDQEKSSFSEVASVHSLMLRLLMLSCSMVIVFSQFYAQPLLYFYGGEAMMSGNAMLLFRMQGFNVLLLAIITATETYCMAAMSQKEVDDYNKTTAVIACGYLGMCYTFTWLLGSPGLIIANCATLLFRIRKNYQFLGVHFKGSEFQTLNALHPGANVLTVFGAALLATFFSEILLGFSSHLIAGCTIALVTIVCLLKLESKSRTTMRNLFKDDSKVD